MLALRAAVEKAVGAIPKEGLRLKKFRKPILDEFCGDNMTEKQVKEEFAECLDGLCSSGVVSLDGGILTRLKSVSSGAESTQRYEGDEEDTSGEDVSEIKVAIEKQINLLPGEGLRLKKFRKAVMDQFPDRPDQEVKDEFASLLDSFCADSVISLDGGMLTRLVDHVNVSESRNKRKCGSDNFDDQKSKFARVDDEVAKKELWKYGEQIWADGTLDNSYMTENPDGITRLFCGNLKKEITEEQLHNAINGITHIKWMTDKITREFYGSTFIEMKDPKAAAAAVMLDKTKLLGRPLKIYYCPPRPGDVWPPKDQGRGPNNPAPRTIKEIQPKPPGCRKLFCGNLSYEIDDEVICHFFKDCGELTGLRWLTRKDSGEFRGCAFIEFGTTAEADLAIQKNGEMLLQRPIRLDWDQ